MLPVTDFDPYHKWLGIPPEDSAGGGPNHYRLLGVAAFESDAEVISEAADRQMAHLRSYQLGKHPLLAERLLSEVATARGCLLKPSKKSLYDQHLRRQLLQAKRRGDVVVAVLMAVAQRKNASRATRLTRGACCGPKPISRADFPRICPLLTGFFRSSALIPWANVSYTNPLAIRREAFERGSNFPMTMDKSLRVRRGLIRSRGVLTRAERITRLQEADRWKEGPKRVGVAQGAGLSS